MYQAVPALRQLQVALGGSFVSTRSSTVKAIRKNYPQADALHLRSMWPKFSAGYRQMSESDLIVTGSPNNSLLKTFRAKKYMVFHGTYAYLSVNEVRAMEHFDHLCVLGPRMMQVVENAGLAGKASFSGYLPFLEYPQKDAGARQQFLLGLGLDPAKKTLLYLPWGKPYGSWDLIAEKLLREIPASYNLILRPHPSQSVTMRFRDRLGFMRLQKIIKARGAAYLDLTAQKLPLLYAHADLIISDGTSPAEESLYYDLPQIFVETERFSRTVVSRMMHAKNSDKKQIESVIRLYDCGKILAPQTVNLERLVQDAIDGAHQYADERNAYFKFAFGARNNDAQKKLIESMRQYA